LGYGDAVASIRWLWAGVVCGLVAVPGHAESPTPSSLAGSWGGAHIELIASDQGARVVYDCASGTIDESLRPDSSGRFEARGSYTPERGGPVLRGRRPPRPQPARYQGWTDGTELRITVTLRDTDTAVGSFSLQRGRPARLEKCL
jgi:hypothetical protein